MKKVIFIFDECKGCPYVRKETTDNKYFSFSYLCSLMRLEEIEDEYSIPEWCPLDDAEEIYLLKKLKSGLFQKKMN